MATAQHPELAKSHGQAATYEIMVPPMEALWPNQHRVLTMWSDFASHWMERRQRAAQTGVEAAQQMVAASGQPAKMAEIASAWMRGSLERIAADMQEYQACCGQAATMMQTGMQQTLPHLGEGSHPGEGEHGKGRSHTAKK